MLDCFDFVFIVGVIILPQVNQKRFNSGIGKTVPF